MNFQVHHNNQSKLWCGPAVIAALTDYDTKTVTRTLREVSGRPKIRGIYNSWLIAASKRLGWLLKRCKFDVESMTLRQFVTKWGYLSYAAPIIINVTRHYVILHRGQFWENQIKDPVPFDKIPRCRRRVQVVYRCFRHDQPHQLPKKPVLRSPGERTLRYYLKSVAEMADCEVCEREYRPGEWWVYPPDGLSDEDPYDTDHLTYSTQEAIDRVLEYYKLERKLLATKE